MTRSLAACVAVLAGLPAAAAPVPRDAGGPLYFPTTVGAEWVYERPGRADEAVRVSGVARDGGAVVVSRQTADGNGIAYSDVTVDADGLRQEPRGGSPDLAWLMKTKARKGDSWDVPDGRRTTHGPEPVEVPAGRYMAVRVVLDEGGSRMTSWYAPGVGEVKRVLQVGDGEPVVNRQLKSFRAR